MTMTRKEFIEQGLLAALNSSEPIDKHTIIYLGDLYDAIHADDQAPEKLPTYWVSFAERAPTEEDADPKGNVGFMPCAEHAEGRRLLEVYWDAFDASLHCPNCYWCRLPGAGE